MPHVLIVEDDPLVRGAVERIFRSCSTTLVVTVEHALEAMDQHRFDAVVTDWNLLDRDARPVVARCQRDGVPFRVFSGSYPERDLWKDGVWLCKTSPSGLRGFKEEIEGRRQ